MAKGETTTSTTPERTMQIVPTPVRTDELVDAWFVETFHNRGMHVEDFNHFRHQADVLKARLRAAK